MYGFSIENLPFFLIGQDLLQICLGSNEVIINFENDCSITVMSVDSFMKYNSGLLNSIIKFDQEYVGKKIESVELVDINSIILKLDIKNFITLFDDSKEYESVIFRESGNVYSV